MSKETPRQHSYHSSHDYQGGQGPGISVHQATPQATQYSSSSTGSALPGVLQSGRPNASASMTAPSSIPTLPPLQNPNQSANSSRPSTANQAHSYSRSSPAGLDQPKYGAFVGTPQNAQYSSDANHRYASSQTGLGESAYSPLGLADIRPLNESGALDPHGSNPYSSDNYPNTATNSNYLAPWPIYAFDWCKWPIQNQQLGDSAGKMAVGSYVEDGHNFVGIY